MYTYIFIYVRMYMYILSINKMCYVRFIYVRSLLFCSICDLDTNFYSCKACKSQYLSTKCESKRNHNYRGEQ